jgi:hypothetical protein
MKKIWVISERPYAAYELEDEWKEFPILVDFDSEDEARSVLRQIKTHRNDPHYTFLGRIQSGELVPPEHQDDRWAAREQEKADEDFYRDHPLHVQLSARAVTSNWARDMKLRLTEVDLKSSRASVELGGTEKA